MTIKLIVKENEVQRFQKTSLTLLPSTVDMIKRIQKLLNIKSQSSAVEICIRTIYQELDKQIVKKGKVSVEIDSTTVVRKVLQNLKEKVKQTEYVIK